MIQWAIAEKAVDVFHIMAGIILAVSVFKIAVRVVHFTPSE